MLVRSLELTRFGGHLNTGDDKSRMKEVNRAGIQRRQRHEDGEQRGGDLQGSSVERDQRPGPDGAWGSLLQDSFARRRCRREGAHRAVFVDHSIPPPLDSVEAEEAVDGFGDYIVEGWTGEVGSV